MRILIDGYNLLHASGVFATETGPDTLQQSRQALLDALADQLEPRFVKLTLVVFDAAGAPPGLPRQAKHRGLAVRYASPQADADQLIEELIDADRAPRELLVVSSDHRLQRAARRRGAESIDSELWFAEITRQARRRNEQSGADPAKRGSATSNAEIQYWLRKFGIESIDEADVAMPRIERPSAGNSKPNKSAEPDEKPIDERPIEEQLAEFDEFLKERLDEPFDDPIFPPGYGEDLLEDEE